MLIRFGFVAMSAVLENASPSKAVTFKTYHKLAQQDPIAALEKVKRVAQENLINSLRLLRYCKAHSIKIYRFSSKIVPLATHPELTNWDYIKDLTPQLRQIGEFIKDNRMRVTFHPDHYTLINSPSEKVYNSSLTDLKHHCRLLDTMGLNKKAKLIIHVGGGYGNKEKSLERFIANWTKIPEYISKRMTLENDDKTFTANDTLYLCEKLQIPMVLDLHHFWCNHEHNNSLEQIYPRFISTWKETNLPPKIHVSSPKCETNIRSHHDYVNPESLYSFLTSIRDYNQDIDAMVEAKQKDKAMLQLVQELSKMPGIKLIDEACLEI